MACTERACADAGRDAGVICEHNGTRYMPGASFPAGDGCNTCNCTETGFVACTRRACPADGGGGVCTPGADHTCNDDPTMSAIAGVCRTDGTCDCSRTATNPRTGKCVPVPTDGGVDGCSYRGAIYPVGSSFPSTDGCNTCTCTASGVACTARACPPTCDRQLDASYQYGDVGGLRASQDRVALTPPMSYVYTRTDFGTVGGVQSCAPPMPPCGSAVIDVGELVAAFGHVDVQKALAAASPPLYGVDTRPVDGTVFELLRADGRGFRVGRACQSTGTELVACPAIPAGVQALVDVLGRLDAQQLKDPACGMLAATR